MARHSPGRIVALSSDIASCFLMTAKSVAPIRGLICAGVSSNASSSRSTTGRGISDVAVVVEVVLAWLLPPHPATRIQTPAMANVAAKWPISSFPIPVVAPTRSAAR